MSARAMEITAPQIDYGLLLPFLIVFAGACLGVLVEAALPRAAPPARPADPDLPDPRRRPGRDGAELGDRRRAGLTGVGSVAVDGPTHFMWALLLVFGAISFLLFADRTAENGRSAFAPQAAAVPGHRSGAGGHPGRRRAHRGLSAGAVRAVRDDAVRRLVGPDHHVRGAGDLVAAALPAVRSGPAPAAAQSGGRAQVLPAGRLVLGVLPLRGGAAVRLRGLLRSRGDRRRHPDRRALAGSAAGRHGPARGRTAVQVRSGAVPLLDPRRLRRAPPPR